MTGFTPAISHVIFDMDGVLLDTENIYTEVTQEIVGRFGKTYNWSIKSQLIGRPSLESATDLVRLLDLPITPQQYLDERNAMLTEAFPRCNPLPGVEKLIGHLGASGVPIAVATSSDRKLFEVKTSHHQKLFSNFNTIVTGDDPRVGRGKPAPDIFLLAAEQIGAAPESTLVVEDAPSGLAAGIAAGMRVVAVPDANMDRSRYDDASVILGSLEEFSPGYFGLPPYPDQI